MAQQSIYMFFDDSGVFHKNDRYFIYAGYVFIGSEEKDGARRKYKKIVKQIKNILNRNDELKAFNIENKYKRALLRVLKSYIRIAVVVDLQKIKDEILDDKKSRVRFKDFALKRLVKKIIKKMIEKAQINPRESCKIYLNIDEQSTATNGVYGLRDSIKEELAYGIYNYDYSVFYEPIIQGELQVELHYCQSVNEYLIQAADILANTVHHDVIKGARYVIDSMDKVLYLP